MRASSSVPTADNWTDPRHRRGLAGELAAIRFLESRGWQIEAHRFRLGHHDVDLVARRGSLVAFVEVKTRMSLAYGRAIESVGWKKRRDIGRVAAVWALRFGKGSDLYRFDLIGVEFEKGAFPQITHIEDAWRGVEK